MKTKVLTIIASLLLLVSCGGGYNPPDTPGGDNNKPGSGTETTKKPEAYFIYETYHPLSVYFQNKSVNATSYKWDFGDGNTSTEKAPTHKYKSKGVYKVTLTAERGSEKHKYTASVTIEEPTVCYVTGVKYEAIPKNNEYYNIRFTDDYIMFETLYWCTDWVMLSSANLPYNYNLSKKKQLDLSNSKHVMRLYQNSKSSGTGSQVASWVVNTSNLKSGFPESTTGSSSNAKVTLLLKWE